jgi:hypothetical protein
MTNSKNHPIALITGASAGIGAEFARQLAAKNYSLILVSRRLQNLQSIADELRSRYGVFIEVESVDLSKTNEIKSLANHVATIDNLNLLVNNAGFGSNDRFYRAPCERHIEMITVHIEATVRLTHAVVPGMIERHKGGIINVASIAAFIPLRSVTYSSTKSFLVTFSQALNNDLHGKGVQVQVLCPGLTYTEFHDTPEFRNFDRQRFPKLLWLSAQKVVNQSLSDLEHGRLICIPGWQYRWIVFFARNSLTSWIVNTIGTNLHWKSR